MRLLRLLRTVLAFSLLLALAVLALSSSSSRADDNTLSLQTVPHIPVGSTGLRERLPHHPHGPSESAPPPCDKDIDLTSTILGVTAVAAQNNTICTSADIDVYEQDGDLYVVQAAGQEAAFTITRIAADGSTTLVTQRQWQQANTYTPDVKAFKQGSKRYIALSLERLAPAAACGVVIIDVTDPANITGDSIVEQFIGSDWCDVHNSFVENDTNGEGAFIYATADNTYDLRVLDIRDLNSITELGKYRRTVRGSFGSGTFDDVYVHDVTVLLGRVYASYWRAGLDMFDASLIKVAGATVNETHPGVVNITPPLFNNTTPFLVHHAYASESGDHVFIEDEITFTAGFEPVQMWTTASSPSYVDGVALAGSGPGDVPFVLPAHNLLVRGHCLYVGWYKAGLQAFRFSDAGLTARPIYHQVQTEGPDDSYDGAWGIRTGNRGSLALLFQSDRRYGLIVEAINATLDNDGDGFPDHLEFYLNSDSCRACPATASADDEDRDAWPPDFNDTQNVDGFDVFLLAQRFGSDTGFTPEGKLPYSARYDLNADGAINGLDVFRLAQVFNTTCS